jgi:hypothetical protein
MCVIPDKIRKRICSGNGLYQLQNCCHYVYLQTIKHKIYIDIATILPDAWNVYETNTLLKRKDVIYRCL